MEKQGCLLSTFLQARKHRVIKALASGRHAVQNYDRGIMEEVTVKHLHDIASHTLFNVDLLAPKKASAKLAKALRDALPIDP
eukprot:6548971-Pyramimonas_sp.AAC.1